MIETHTIRLRGPWQCEIGGRTKRIQMPVRRSALLDGEYGDRLRCHRRFGSPTCLDPHERVWLLIDQPARPGQASLNEEPLGEFNISAIATEFDITDRLRDRNLLRLEFDFGRAETIADGLEPAAAPSALSEPLIADELLFKEVRLEIRG